MAGAGYKLFNTGDVLTAAQVNTYLQEQVVMVFADAAARTTALSGVLAEGMASYLKDTDSFEVYNGSAWVSASGDLTALTAGTGISISSATGPIPTVTNSMATEITASGDIIVGTGSGTFDNLPIGTTGQVLTADTTVSPYKVKWASAASSGGLTFITSQTFSSVASVTFTSCFTSSYVSYLIVFEDIYAASGNDDLQMQWRYSTTTETGTSHYGSTSQFYSNSATTSTTGYRNAAQMTLSNALGGTGQSSGGYLFAHNLGQTGRPMINGQHYASDVGNEPAETFGGGWAGTSRVFDGFVIKSSSSNITGTIRVYGLAKS